MMKKSILGLAAVTVLAGCSTSQIQQACQADAIAQPLAAGLAVPVTTLADPSATPDAAGLVALDNTAIHPAIQAACTAAVAGK